MSIKHESVHTAVSDDESMPERAVLYVIKRSMSLILSQLPSLNKVDSLEEKLAQVVLSERKLHSCRTQSLPIRSKLLKILKGLTPSIKEVKVYDSGVREERPCTINLVQEKRVERILKVDPTPNLGSIIMQKNGFDVYTRMFQVYTLAKFSDMYRLSDYPVKDELDFCLKHSMLTANLIISTKEAIQAIEKFISVIKPNAREREIMVNMLKAEGIEPTSAQYAFLKTNINKKIK